MSLAAAVCHAEWQDRKLNLIDAPGDPGFQADSIAALRVVEGALFVLNGVNGVEVQTTRLWDRSKQLGLSRVIFVNMLDRERADFFTVIEQLREQFSKHASPCRSRSATSTSSRGSSTSSTCAPTCRRRAAARAIRSTSRRRSPRTRRLLSRAARGRRRRDRRGAHGALPRGGRGLGRRARGRAEEAVSQRRPLPVLCGSATKNLGTTGLLDLLVEGVPVAGEEAARPRDRGERCRSLRLEDRRGPVRRAHQRLPCPLGLGGLRLEPRQPAHEGQGAVRPGSPPPGEGAFARGRPPGR